MHCFQRQFHIRLGYETLSFLFFEQFFQLSLLDKIFDIDSFLIIPKYTFFDFDDLPITWRNADISAIDNFLIRSPTPIISESDSILVIFFPPKFNVALVL